MKTPILIRAFAFLLLLPAVVLAGSEKIKATAVPKQSHIKSGDVIEIPIALNLEGFPEQLGSYTATLTWNPNVLQFEGCMDGSTAGFEKPVVNQTQTAQGKLLFAHANPYGGEGVVNILNVKFKVIGKSGSTSDLSLHFSAMAAAKTFNDLLPHLAQETQFEQALEVAEIPESYGLEQNYPNPFNAGTAFKFALPEEARVRLEIFDVLGKRVRILLDEQRPAGYHVINWDGKDEASQVVSSGVYLFRFQAEEFVVKRKMLLIK